MGHKFTIMVDDERFSKSINIAKWNIYVWLLLTDLAHFYVSSYLNERKKFKENDSKEIFLNIIDKEKENGLSEEIHIKQNKEIF